MDRDVVESSAEQTSEPVDDADAPLERNRDELQDDPASMPLFASEESAAFDSRWHDIQVAFVDEPRQAVERADQLVEELVQQLTSSFARQRGELETQWDRGEDVSTEDLRLALTRYRSFFQRLLAA